MLVLRNEDLDATRFKLEFVGAMLEDLKWFGFEWQEGPDCGGPFGPYHQSERREFYLAAMRKLLAGGFIYPCTCSRRTCGGRCPRRTRAKMSRSIREPAGKGERKNAEGRMQKAKSGVTNWRFRVPDGETISFVDGRCGPQQFVAGKDFGDFVVWRHDGVPAYQLYVVVDDAAMQITEVVRGADLLKSTARQLLLYRALGLPVPQFYHCPLMTDEKGVRLAKRHDALSLRRLRAAGIQPAQLRAHW